MSEPAAAKLAAAGTPTSGASQAGAPASGAPLSGTPATGPPTAGSSGFLRSHRTLAILTSLLLLLAVAGAVTAIVLIGKHRSPTAAVLGQRRAHLAFVAQELRSIEGRVEREMSATKAVWPEIAYGLPKSDDGSIAKGVKKALEATEAVPSPRFVPLIEELVGPAAGIADLFRSFTLLTRTGWQHVDAALTTIEHGPSAAARFARSSAGLYIDSIYEGGFYASVLGEHIEKTYEKLGGEAFFGAKLTMVQVQSLARVYSPQADVLKPHALSALQTVGGP